MDERGFEGTRKEQVRPCAACFCCSLSSLLAANACSALLLLAANVLPMAALWGRCCGRGVAAAGHPGTLLRSGCVPGWDVA